LHKTHKSSKKMTERYIIVIHSAECYIRKIGSPIISHLIGHRALVVQQQLLDYRVPDTKVLFRREFLRCQKSNKIFLDRINLACTRLVWEQTTKGIQVELIIGGETLWARILYDHLQHHCFALGKTTLIPHWFHTRYYRQRGFGEIEKSLVNYQRDGKCEEDESTTTTTTTTRTIPPALKEILKDLADFSSHGDSQEEKRAKMMRMIPTTIY